MEEEKVPLLNLELQLSKDNAACIVIYEGDDLEESVDKFCLQHKLNNKVKDIIMKQLIDKINENITQIEQIQDESNAEGSRHESQNHYNEDNEGDEENKRNEGNEEENNETKEDNRDNRGNQAVEQQENLEESMGSRANLETDRSPGKSRASDFRVNRKRRDDQQEDDYESVSGNNSKITTTRTRENKFRDLTPSESYCVSRYNEYFLKQEKKQAHVDKVMRKRARNEMKGVTFSPSLNSRSIEIFDRINKGDKVEERLLNYGMNKAEKLVKERAHKLNKQYSQQTFQPSINDKSKILAEIVKKNRTDLIEKINTSSLEQKDNSVDIEVSLNHTENLSHTQKTQGRNNKNNPNDKTLHLDDSRFNYQIKSSMISESFTNMAARSRTPDNKGKVYNKKGPNLFTTTNQSKKSVNNKQINNVSKSRSKSKTQSSVANSTSGSKQEVYAKKKVLKASASTNTIHDFLYNDAKIQGLKKRQNEQFWDSKVQPFTPQIPNPVRNLVTRQETTAEFINRLHRSKDTADELIVEIKKREKLDGSVDRVTGQELFKPKITRGPLNPEKRKENFDLDTFYNQKLLEDNKKIHEEEMLNNLEKKKHYLEISMKSVLKMKIDKYREIFNMLDSDQDGLISSRNIRLSTVNTDILECLTPVLESLQKSDQPMNLKEFCLAADKFLSSKIFTVA